MPVPTGSTTPSVRVRLDKWLWAARFYKTRGLSADEIDKGRVHVNGQSAKPSREVRIGDTIELRNTDGTRTIVVRGLSGVRGPAPVAALLF
jgi:ribosome-associated heat shock protein Hsp15